MYAMKNLSGRSTDFITITLRRRPAGRFWRVWGIWSMNVLPDSLTMIS